jgi:hypothetical protein
VTAAELEMDRAPVWAAVVAAKGAVPEEPVLALAVAVP